MTGKMWRRLAGLALTMTLLSGCDLFSPPETGEEALDCTSLPSTPPSPQDDRVAVVIDVSRSTRSTVPETAIPAYRKRLRSVIANAVNAKAGVSIGVFSGQDLTWMIDDQATRSDHNNPKRQAAQAVITTNCLTTAVDSAVTQPARKPGTDVLNAIRAAADHVNDTTGKKSIVVATDGLPTSGCADLTRTTFAGDDEIKGIVAVCRDRKEMVAGQLNGVDLEMVGVGHPGPEQPAASAEQLAWLKQLWQGLCEAGRDGGGGRCDISTKDPGREATRVNTPDGPSDVAVTFSATWRFVVPAAALFDTGKWDLRDGGEALLLEIAIAIRTTPHSTVHVNGHADATGDHQRNQDLSEQRAAEVAKFLASNGVSGIDSRGFGDTQPACPEIPADDDCLQRNRRVEIIATRA